MRFVCIASRMCQHYNLKRHSHVYSGTFEGKPVSIVSTMMGMANMDFVIRECQAIVEGSMAMIRLGTCGAVHPPAGLGSFLVASQGSICIRCVLLLMQHLVPHHGHSWARQMWGSTTPSKSQQL